MELNPLYRLYVELNTKVDGLIQNGVPSNSVGDVSDLVVRIKNLETRPTYDSAIIDLTKNIKKVQLDLDEVIKRVDTGLSKIDNLESRIYNLETEPKVNIIPLDQRVSTIESANYNDALVNLESKIGNMEQLVNAITDITYRINEIEKKPDLNQRLSALEMNMSSLNLNPQ
jgi:peptidoglycan hydrolase CwlO-like protein